MGVFLGKYCDNVCTYPKRKVTDTNKPEVERHERKERTPAQPQLVL